MEAVVVLDFGDVLLVSWNLLLLLIIFFEKSRVDYLEQCVGVLVKHQSEEKEGSNDWR
jgi:hypothetical protein